MISGKLAKENNIEVLCVDKLETLKIARPEKGAKVLDTTTCADYKVANGVLDKRKIRLCVCGNQ